MTELKKYTKEELKAATERFLKFVDMMDQTNLVPYPSAVRFLEACMISFIEAEFPNSGRLGMSNAEYATLINRIQKGE